MATFPGCARGTAARSPRRPPRLGPLPTAASRAVPVAPLAFSLRAAGLPRAPASLSPDRRLRLAAARSWRPAPSPGVRRVPPASSPPPLAAVAVITKGAPAVGRAVRTIPDSGVPACSARRGPRRHQRPRPTQKLSRVKRTGPTRPPDQSDHRRCTWRPGPRLLERAARLPSSACRRSSARVTPHGPAESAVPLLARPRSQRGTRLPSRPPAGRGRSPALKKTSPLETPQPRLLCSPGAFPTLAFPDRRRHPPPPAPPTTPDTAYSSKAGRPGPPLYLRSGGITDMARAAVGATSFPYDR